MFMSKAEVRYQGAKGAEWRSNVSNFDKLKLALDDIRARHKAVYDLIVLTEQQALSFLRLYVTLGLAAASGAVTGIVGNASISTALGGGLLIRLGRT